MNIVYNNFIFSLAEFWPIFQTGAFIIPEFFCMLAITILLVYGLLIPVVYPSLLSEKSISTKFDSGVKNLLSENYSVCLSWLTILSLVFLVILFIQSAGIGQESFLFGNHYLKTDHLTYWKLLLTVTFIGVLILSLEYQKYENLAVFEYPLLFFIAFLAILFLMSENIFLSFYLALEAQSLSLYILAGFARKNELSTEAAVKYFILGVLASGVLLLGISFIYMVYGTFNFVDLHLIYATPTLTKPLGDFGLILVVIALMFKLAAAPFHIWSPDVYEGAPLPSTIFFATVVKLTSIVICSRILLDVFVNTALWYPVVSLCSILSLAFGAFGTLYQAKLKRFIAYSGITHIGFVLMCFCCVPDKAMSSLAFYAVVYLMTMLGLLGVSICLIDSRGPFLNKRLIYLADFSLLIKKNLLLAMSGILFLFSLAGIPPVAGFFAKFYVIFSLVNSNVYFLAMFGLLTSVLTSFYYIRLIRTMAFATSSPTTWRSVKTPSREVSLLIGVSLFIISFYAIHPNFLLTIADYFQLSMHYQI
jgi:NADH-quinone oxidoreductase subunit N